jgi:hypothetical protein
MQPINGRQIATADVPPLSAFVGKAEIAIGGRVQL